MKKFSEVFVLFIITRQVAHSAAFRASHRRLTTWNLAGHSTRLGRGQTPHFTWAESNANQA